LRGSSRGPQRLRPRLLKTLIDANTPASVQVRAADADATKGGSGLPKNVHG